MGDTQKQSAVLGIDLGTTYACVAYINDQGHAEVIPNSDTDLITPTVVSFEGRQ